MKRFVAILCLFVIMFQSMSTLCIYTAFALNRNYISENICINRFDSLPVCKGQCYLSDKLKENEKQEKKFPDLKQKEIPLFCEEKNLLNAPSLLSAQTDIIPNNAADFIISGYAASIFHPPPIA